MNNDNNRCPNCFFEDSEDTAQRLMGAFMRVNRQHRHRRAVEGLRPHEYHIMHVLRRFSCENPAGPRASDLSEGLGVAPPTITQQISELERRGLVVRRRDESDRRTVRILLSSAGMELLDRGRTEVLNLFSSIVDRLGEDRAGTLASLLAEAADCLEAANCGN